MKYRDLLILLSICVSPLAVQAQYGGLDTTKFPWLHKPIQAAEQAADSLRTLPSSPAVQPVNPVTVYGEALRKGVGDSSMVDRVLATAYSKIGAHYKFGGKGPNHFDCAGFTRWVYLHYDITLAPSAGAQYPQGSAIKDTRNLRPGDLVFYGARRKHAMIGHVGMVVEADSTTGNFRFIHSSTSLGVTISSSREPYYVQRYIGACRILPDEAWVSPHRAQADSLAAAQLQQLHQAMMADSLRREQERQDSLLQQLNRRLDEAQKDVDSHRRPHEKSPVEEVIPRFDQAVKPTAVRRFRRR